MEPDDRSSYPRPLTERERAVLEFVLAVDDPRAAPLREQASRATVTGMCTCGCATIDLGVDRSVGRPALLGSPAIEAAATGLYGGSRDPDRAFELLLFLDEGWLASLEIVSYGRVPLSEFPEPSTFDAPWLSAGS